MAILTADAQLVFGFRTQTYGNKSSEIPNILVQATAGFNFAQTISVTPIIFRGGVISLEPAASASATAIQRKGIKENLVVESQCNLLLPTGISIDFSKLGIAWDLETDFTFEMEEDFVREEEGNQTPLPAIANLLTFRTPTWYYAAINSNFSQNTVPLRIKQLAASFPQALGNITFKITYNPGRFASLFVNNITMTPVVVKRVRGAAAFNSEFNRVINNLRVRYSGSIMTNTFSFTQPSEQGRIRFVTPSLTNDVVFYLDPTFTFRPSPSLTAVSTIASTPYVDWVSGANINSEASIVNTPTVLWYALSSIQSNVSLNNPGERIRPFESNTSTSTSLTAEMNYITSSVTVNAQATSSLSCSVDTPFIAKITVSAGETVTLYPYGTVNAQVDWGDGNLVSWTTTGAKSVTYPSAGQFTIRIYGTLTRLGNGITNLWINKATTLAQADGIVSLGQIGLTEVTGMCSGGMIVPTGLPSSLTSLQAAFYKRGNATAGASSMPMSRAYRETVRTWNTANITNMRHCFSYCASSGSFFETNLPAPNPPGSSGNVAAQWSPRISGTWDTSAVTDMSYMYYEAIFYDPGGTYAEEAGDYTWWQSWDTGNVTNMSYMFAETNSVGGGQGITQANSENLNNWNVSSVTNMEAMFKGNFAKAQAIAPTNIGNWDTSNVTNFSSMFENYLPYNRSLTEGNASRALNGINNWNTGSATTMANMWRQSYGFNLNIGAWDTSNVTTMENMFYVSGDPNGIFNQSLANWDVSQVTNMDNMFRGQASYNQNLTGWCVTLIPTQPSFFYTNVSWTQRPVWGTCPP
jgi:hypothetical protein